MEIPLVTSDWAARHDGHVFDGFGAIWMPHMQHRMLTMVPPVGFSIVGGCRLRFRM